jgi:hypothetical protein
MITLEELENRIDKAQSTLATMQDVVQGLKTNIEELKEEQKEPTFDLYGWNPCTIKFPDHVLQDIDCDFVAVMLMHKDVYKEYCEDVESLPVDASSVQDGSLFIGYMYFSLNGAEPTFKYANGSPIFDKGSEEKLDPKNYYFKYVFGGI